MESTAPALPAIRHALLAWYDHAKRDLPWRRTQDPYAIWVSEIMLQQTRVDTVIPYYERFMTRFPTAAALAEAPEDDVMAHWSGLGYYRRARLLHAGVRELVATYGGAVPPDADARLSLPGVGRYTAGAIGSIAFEKEEPIVDGNVARVFARVFDIETPLGETATETRLWTLATDLVRGPRPGDLNQAVMELGATVCTPANPKCDVCPLAAHCIAKDTGRIDSLPVPRKKKPPKRAEMVAVLAYAGPNELILERGDKKLWGGLWSPLFADGHGRDAAVHALATAQVVADLADTPTATLRHILTHRDLRVEVWRADDARVAPSTARKRVPMADLDALGISTLTRKIIDATRQLRLL